MSRLTDRLILTAGAMVLWPTCVTAHAGQSQGGGFLAGFAHPFSGWDHLLAMVAIGLWGAFLGRPLVYLLPIVFPTIMAIGGALGMSNVPVPPVEIGIAASVLVLGTAIAFALKPPVWAAVATVAVFGLFHGYAHGQELPSIADPIAYSCGFVLATGLLHLSGIAAGTVHARPYGAMLVRGCGALIAIAGIWFMVRALHG